MSKEHKRAYYDRMVSQNVTLDPYKRTSLKQCRRCHRVKLVTDFGIDRGSKYGLRTVCKECRNSVQRKLNGGGAYPSYRERSPMHEKTCSFCNELKPLNGFPPQKAGRSGRSSQCRVCCNMKRRAYTYGMNLDAFHALLEKQGGKCAACSVDLELSGRGHTSVAVDHCHDTGRVRGLLCCMCNRALGMLGDDADTVGGLYEYIRRS